MRRQFCLLIGKQAFHFWLLYKNNLFKNIQSLNRLRAYKPSDATEIVRPEIKLNFSTSIFEYCGDSLWKEKPYSIYVDFSILNLNRKLKIELCVHKGRLHSKHEINQFKFLSSCQLLIRSNQNPTVYRDGVRFAFFPVPTWFFFAADGVLCRAHTRSKTHSHIQFTQYYYERPRSSYQISTTVNCHIQILLRTQKTHVSTKPVIVFDFRML